MPNPAPPTTGTAVFLGTLFQPRPAIDENIKQNVPGAAGGATPSEWVNAARAVYPLYGSAAFPVEPLPPDPASRLNLADFNSWHSEHQRQYMLANGGVHQILGAGNVVLGHFRLVDNGARPINLMNLTLSEYAMLSAADKAAIQTDLIDLGIANRLGLSANKSAATDKIDEVRDLVNSSVLARPDLAQERQVFLEQLAILERRVNAAPMVVTDKVLAEAGAIAERLSRIDKFVSTRSSVRMSGMQFDRAENSDDKRWIGELTGVQARGFAVSSDNEATIDAGVVEFMRAERSILASMKRREGLSGNDALRDPKLDLANLIFQLQLLYETEAESIASGGTEEIRQLHKLLQDYGVMQRLVQETIKHYDPSKPDERRRFMNLGGLDDGGVQTNNTGINFSNQDTRILFFLRDDETNFTWAIQSAGGRTNRLGEGTNAYDNPPGYHWFHLQAETPGGVLGPVVADSNADGWDGIPIHQAYSRQWERDGDTMRITGNPNTYGKQNGGLSEEEMRIFGMFSDDTWARTLRQDHPMESLYGISRPTLAFSGENEQTRGGLDLVRKTVWDSFSTQLNDAVTLLNQRNQLKQNEIENATRRQNRHFELGNNALRKMNDLLMTIGRM